MIHSYVIGRGNTATAYLHAGVIRPAPGPTADAVVDVQAALGRRVPGEATLSWAGRTPTPNAGGKAPQKIYWEGNILNKISKKIVALVTMAAFVLTLVPVAAFAANVGDANAAVALVDGEKEVSEQVVYLNASNKATATLNVTAGDANLEENGTRIGVWTDAEKNNTPDDLTAAGVSYATTVGNKEGQSAWDNVTWLYGTGAEANQTFEVTVNFTKAGVYPIYAGYWTTGDNVIADTDPVLVGTVTVVDPVVSAQTSYFGTVDAKVSAAVGEAVPVEFDLRDAGNKDLNDIDGVYDAQNTIAIWATDGNTVTDALLVDGSTANPVAAGIHAYKLADLDDVTVSFSRAANSGSYTLHAALVGTADSIAELEKNEIASNDSHKTVEVTAKESTVKSVAIYNETDKTPMTVDKNGEYNDTLTTANGAESKTYTVTVKDANGDAVANKKVAVSSSSSALRVTAIDMDGNESTDGTVTTDRKGQFQIRYNATQAGTYKLYIEVDSLRATVNVEAGDLDRYAETIAANEKDVTLDAAQVKATNLANAVTYTLTDNDGNEITTNAISGNDILSQEEGCVSGDADYVKLLTKPDNFKGKATNFKLIYDGDAKVYTLDYTGTADLVAGDYTVRLILHSGKYADASFTLGDFNANKVESLSFTTTSDTVEYDGEIHYTVLAVDANGVSRDVTEDNTYALGMDYADGLKLTDDKKGTITVALNGADKEDVIGTKINLIVASDTYGALVPATVTVVDKGVVAGIDFDSTTGEVNTNNAVKATVVDENGKTVKANGKVYAYVVDQSNADAKVDVSVNSVNASDGVANLTIFSDKETTVDIVVGIQKDSKADSAIYADTLTYTIGEKDVNADKMVAMTIGSTDMIVNNEIVAGDAAPYVADSRTMVPIRALTETFGAEVDFKDNVVTIVDGDTTVVMTIDETTYTVNGEEATMDVAPVIGSGDRTYVPIRFVAEALGYKVTPLYAADGTTASVVFQK